MAELTDKDRANLYKMAQGVEARLVKQGYKKGTAEFKAAFERATKGIRVAGRGISETGKAIRSRPTPVKTKGATKAGGRPSTSGGPSAPAGIGGPAVPSTSSASSSRNRSGGLGAINSAPNGLPLRTVPRLNVPASVATPAQLRTPTVVKSGGPGRTPRPSGPASNKPPLRASRPASQKAKPRSTTPKAAPKSTTPKAAPKPAPKPANTARTTRTTRGTGIGARGNSGGGGVRGRRGGGPTWKGR